MTSKTLARLALIAPLVLAAGVAHADGLIIVHDPPLPGPRHPFAPLEVEYHRVEVKITGQAATTTVDQSFFNPNPQRLEGTYIFPIPKGAAIDSFEMDVNGTMTGAELLDADKARVIYEDIVRRMRDPALLEYTGQGLYRARIFPLEPRASKRVRMQYTELLGRDSGLVEYRYPLNTERFSSVPIETVSIRVELENRDGLRTVYSPSHPVEVSRKGSDRAVVAWEASRVTPDTDFRLFYAPDTKLDVGVDLLPYRDGAGDGYFLLLLSPSTQLPSTRVGAKDVVFVLDTSGSMAERGKIDQARQALELCIANLNPHDRFEVVRFSTEAESLMGGLVQATEGNRRRATEMVGAFRPIGGTAIEDALARAIEPAGPRAGHERPYAVVFLTDGRPTVGATDEGVLLEGLRRAVGDRGIRIFCFGLGTDVNAKLLDRIAGETRGLSRYVLPEQDLELEVSGFFAKISHPVLANPRLGVSGGVRLSGIHPHDLPDVYRGDQVVVLGRYHGSGDAALTLEGTVDGRPWRAAFDARFPASARDHVFIPRLWATRRVGFLLDQIRLHGESAELRDEVVELARAYGIVTPYTAYLIVEDEAKRGVPVASRSLPTVDRDARAREEAGRMFNEVRTQSSGDAAVGGAQAMDALKAAETVVAPSVASAHVRRGQGGAGRVDEALAAAEQRYVGGRTFYRNKERWVDGTIAGRAVSRRVRLELASAEYFDLLRRHPETAPWLALGREVELRVGDVVYVVGE